MCALPVFEPSGKLAGVASKTLARQALWRAVDEMRDRVRGVDDGDGRVWIDVDRRADGDVAEVEGAGHRMRDGQQAEGRAVVAVGQVKVAVQRDRLRAQPRDGSRFAHSGG